MQRTALLLSICATALGCPSYAVLDREMRGAVDKAHQGELLFLRQSVYVGSFYDDDRFRLVHPRRFEELTYLQTFEGDAIAPPPAEGIIAAGTRVRVEKIEWPTSDVVFRRPLYTPRYTTWIVLRVAADRGGDVTVEREQRHILLMPAGIVDDATFNLWFAASLTQQDPNPWLLSLPADQQAAIATKQARVGMSYDALTAAWGFPDVLSRDAAAESTREVAVFGPSSVVLVDGVVVEVRQPGAAPAVMAQPAAPVAPNALDAPATQPPTVEREPAVPSAPDGATAPEAATTIPTP